MKTAFFMIEIILSVFSIPLYITKRGKLKNEILAWGVAPWKNRRSPFGSKIRFQRKWGFSYAKRPAWRHGFNEANKNLIRFSELEILIETCWDLTVWFGYWDFITIRSISRAQKIGLNFRLLDRNRGFKPVPLHIPNLKYVEFLFLTKGGAEIFSGSHPPS